jgi:2-iminobutanoate/2-iminopropanoate deaminase
MNKPNLPANYAACRKAGGFLFCSGVIAVDPVAQQVITRYDQLPADAISQLKTLGLVTGQMSVDIFESPIAAQSWFVLHRVLALGAEHGVKPADCVRLVQYFRDLRDYPIYNRVRGLFFEQPVVSTVVEVSRMLPNDQVIVEVEATFVCP